MTKNIIETNIPFAKLNGITETVKYSRIGPTLKPITRTYKGAITNQFKTVNTDVIDNVAATPPITDCLAFVLKRVMAK